MDITAILKLSAFFGMLTLSAFFSSAETAFTAINRLTLRSLIEENKKGAQELEKLYKKPKRLITAILIGNNIANVAASAMATTVMYDFLKLFNINSFLLTTAIVTGLMTLILLTFGEITPKTIAIKKPEKLALLYVKPIKFFFIIFFPLIIIFSGISQIIFKILGISATEADVLTTDKIKSIVKIGKEEGVLEKDEHEMIHSLIDFGETIVREIMTPRTDAICVSVTTTINEIIEIILNSGHSRIPVYEEKIDNILGFIYAKDLLIAKKDPKTPLKNFLREAIFTPETNSITELLTQMKRNKVHISIVVDEHGGTSGLVTLEDIIEEITGEIQDEYDADEHPEFITLDTNHFLVDAKIHIDTLAEELSYKLPEDEDFDTLGGFVLSLMGKFPHKNDEVMYKDIKIIVKEIRKRRIIKLEIYKLENQKKTD